jgi:hypothetical protein
VHAHRSGPDKSDRAHRWQRLFRGQESELRQLRHWLIGLLPESPGRDDLIAVAVELGTNAVQHTASGDGGWFTVEVACLGPMLRVSVTDEGAERGPCLTEDLPADPALDLAVDLDLDLNLDPDLEVDLDDDTDGGFDRGRGLIIVRALAVSCGVCGNASGRTVWAEVAQTRSQAPAPAQTPAQPRTTPSSDPASPNGQPSSNGHPARNNRPGPNGRLAPTGQPALNNQPSAPGGQGRSSRPSASSAMATSRTL